MKITSATLYLLLIALSPLIFLTACGVSSDTDGSEFYALSDSRGEGEEVVTKDTVAQPAHSKLSFSSPQEAVEYMRNSPDKDKYLAGILPQMAYDDLSYCTRLLNNEHPRFIIVDKNRMKVVIFDRFGRMEHTYGMACAKNYGTKHKRADSRTPEGFFDVEGVYDSSEWLFTDDNGVTSDKKGQFGPRFIRLRTPVSYQIGIHGTCAPWSIGNRTSHGCIRIKNENILELVELVEKGMPVIVTPGKKDMAVNAREGYDVPSVSSVVGGKGMETPEVNPDTTATDIPVVIDSTEIKEIPEKEMESSGHEAKPDVTIGAETSF